MREGPVGGNRETKAVYGDCASFLRRRHHWHRRHRRQYTHQPYNDLCDVSFPANVPVRARRRHEWPTHCPRLGRHLRIWQLCTNLRRYFPSIQLASLNLHFSLNVKCSVRREWLRGGSVCVEGGFVYVYIFV